MIKKRDSCLYHASISGTWEDWQRYKTIRNKVTNTLKKEKQNWQTSKVDNLTQNTSSIWKNVKSFIGWKSGGPPSRLMYEGKMYSKPIDLACIMNMFFVSKVAKLIKSIPTAVEDPLAKLRKIFQSKKSKFDLNCVHPDEILVEIWNLKLSKSSGLDNIDSYIVKLAKYELTPAITHIINTAITQGKFPSLWKCAKVVPLLKKDDPTDPKNYRPVALLSVVSKIMERVVFNQIVSFLETNNILHPCHHGFRAQHNTCTALLQMQDLWLEALERYEITAVIMCDMSAAFDIVNHELLIAKLKIFGFQENALAWLTSYLTDRKQRVVVD